MESDLSNGECYLPFEQLGPDSLMMSGGGTLWWCSAVVLCGP